MWGNRNRMHRKQGNRNKKFSNESAVEACFGDLGGNPQ